MYVCTTKALMLNTPVYTMNVHMDTIYTYVRIILAMYVCMHKYSLKLLPSPRSFT